LTSCIQFLDTAICHVLAHFDTEKWSIFGPGWTNFSISPERIQKGVFTDNGNMWVMKDSGVYYWDFNSMTARRYALCGADGEKPLQIALDLKENLWILTKYNIVVWNVKSGKCENITRTGSFPGDSVSTEYSDQFTDLVVADDGVVWIGNYKGEVFRYANNKWMKDDLHDWPINFHLLPSGRLVAEAGSVHLYQDGKWIKIRELDIRYKTFAEDRNGNIWMMLIPCCSEGGTPTEVFRFDGDDWIEVEEAKGGHYLRTTPRETSG
jgi:ligand-binding sensor domain-containing protein